MAKREKLVQDATPLSDNPFAGLSMTLPDGPAAPSEDTAPPPEPRTMSGRAVSNPAMELGGKLVVRRQKKGQGGKAATFVEGLPAPARDALCVQAKRELGCGARVDGVALIVGTSEHRRVAQWLEGLGASSVVLGN